MILLELARGGGPPRRLAWWWRGIATPQEPLRQSAEAADCHLPETSSGRILENQPRRLVQAGHQVQTLYRRAAGASAGPSDLLNLHVFGGSEGIRLIALLDNLGKGASGAAVQNLNLMAGLDETAGLRL